MLKRIIYIPILFCLSWTGVSAQSGKYKPFPENSAVWVTDRYSQAAQGYADSDVYRLQGDTIINSITYNKLYKETIRFYYITPPILASYVSLSPLQYVGGIRQDSINKKVYFCIPTSSKDTLLYDFDLAIGDTLPKTFAFSMTIPTLIVTGFDSININGNFHKIILFDNHPAHGIYAYLIEGVGSYWGPLYFESYQFEGYYNLTCYDGNMINYPGINGACGLSIALTVSNLEEEQYSITIYPNPASGFITISSGETGISDVKVFDLAGREVGSMAGLNKKVFT